MVRHSSPRDRIRKTLGEVWLCLALFDARSVSSA